MNENNPNDSGLTAKFTWLADAPLFIDNEQVDRFYDAVVRPDVKQGEITRTISAHQKNEISGRIAGGLKGGLSNLPAFLSFLQGEVKVEAEGKGGKTTDHGEAEQVVFVPISTPQRQLEDLTLYYLIHHLDRIFLVNNVTEASWRQADKILESPKAILLLNLPSYAESREHGLPLTKLIPVAAEFSDGKTALLYNQLCANDGRRPPDYPESTTIEDPEELRAKRKEYWRWFSENFNPTQAMIVLEEAGAKHGKIRWIAYRIPLNEEGDTLHLNIVGREHYDIGIFGYNFIKRGYKHGLRLIGTLKSEPDLDVLAIYEK